MIFILQVLSGNLSSFLNGRVIKLRITCLTSVEKPCLIFKLKGSITCKFYFYISNIYTNWFTESNVSTLAKTTDGKFHGFDLTGKWTLNPSYSKLRGNHLGLDSAYTLSRRSPGSTLGTGRGSSLPSLHSMRAKRAGESKLVRRYIERKVGHFLQGANIKT